MREGWETLTLDELCEIARGGSPRPIKKYLTDDPDGINWIKISDATASTKYIYRTAQRITKEGIRRSREVKNGDFILSNSMSFGRPYIMRTSWCIHDGWLLLRDKSKLFTQDYLYYFLGSPAAFDQFNRLAAGSTVKNLKVDSVRKVKVPIPPLPEQRRIVGILDKAFDSIATAKANAEKNLQNARALFASYLNDVFSQRGDGWEIEKLDDVCEKIQDGAHRSPKVLYPEPGNGRFPYLTSKNIRTGYLKLDTVQYCDADYHNEIYPRCNAELGDVLLTKDGANTGNVAINTLDEPFSLLSSVCLLKPDSAKLLSRFLAYYIQSNEGFEQITGRMTGAAIKRIILKTIKASLIPLAPLPKQKQIVAKLDSLSQETHHLQSIYQRKLDALDELKKSLLHQAFTGAL